MQYLNPKHSPNQNTKCHYLSVPSEINYHSYHLSRQRVFIYSTLHKKNFLGTTLILIQHLHHLSLDQLSSVNAIDTSMNNIPSVNMYIFCISSSTTFCQNTESRLCFKMGSQLTMSKQQTSTNLFQNTRIGLNDFTSMPTPSINLMEMVLTNNINVHIPCCFPMNESNSIRLKNFH